MFTLLVQATQAEGILSRGSPTEAKVRVAL
jgi:hypothetical protein